MMTVDWASIILDSASPKEAWDAIYRHLLALAQFVTSPVALHDATVTPDRILSEGAWELWEAFPDHAERTSDALKQWCASSGSGGRAILILDALSLRELPFLLGGAQARNIKPTMIKVTGSECPSTTDQFAKALRLPSRSALANNGKPGTFQLVKDDIYTDVLSIPFEDCSIPPNQNVFIWHTWLDDLIHLQHKLPDQIASMALGAFQGDGFWNFVNKLRQGRKLVITSDHGYAVSKRFSSEETDPEAVDILRKTFGASRCKIAEGDWQKRFMPPIVMTRNNQHVVMGQRKWKVQSGFPHVCHGGMSLLEVAVPFLELPAL